LSGETTVIDMDLHSTAFPKLGDDCLAALGECPHTLRKTYQDGDALFRAGDRDSKFFVLISGNVEIVDETGDEPKTVVTHNRGQFAGDVSQITGRPAVVSAYARGATDVYEVSQDALREMLNAHPDFADKVFNAFIARRQLLRASPDFLGLRVIGPHSSTETFRVRDFLTRNSMKCTWIDSEADPTVADLLKKFQVGPADLPLVLFGSVVVLRNPSNRELADAVGLRRKLESKVYDLVIVGAGPAGLAAAVYGASEGLSTVVLEQCAAGGQAGRSMRIENYLGFPTGITGSELADRAVLQASKFGAALPIASEVVRLEFNSRGPVLHLDGDETVAARCVLIATGAEYRVLGIEGCDRLAGRGVFYAAGPMELPLCRGAEVVVVGGGNSAGQAAVYLASHADRVHLVIRGDDLNKSMSSYLVHRIQQTDNITIECNTEIRRLDGDDALGEIEWFNTKSGKGSTLKSPALFSFIGAMPRTDWLPPEIERDAKEFVQTGAAVAQSPHWTGKRHPFFLETSRPGVFAAGDVRAGSVKRVASAVGEGSMAVQFVHEHLKQS
jgi:thioredoxin reductase (NADPH)